MSAIILTATRHLKLQDPTYVKKFNAYYEELICNHSLHLQYYDIQDHLTLGPLSPYMQRQYDNLHKLQLQCILK